MDNLLNVIDNQISTNKGINLFFEGENLFEFSSESILAIEQIINIGELPKSLLIDYTINKVLQEFYRINQYYNFDSQSKVELREIYTTLFDELKAKTDSNEELARIHYSRLKKWLQSSAPFSEKIYSSKEECVEPIHCYEYSPELQLDILQINTTQLTEPVLDIGCGEHGLLVKFLRNIGIEAYGIDRYLSDTSYIVNTDWLEYDYGINKWGTIISNLGFSNHFMHHHLREDGNFIDYAKKYMQILNSLEIGGSFHYAPDLPFIEQYLDSKQYKLSFKELNNQRYKSVVVTRLS